VEQCIKSVTFEVRRNTWMKNISERNASGLSIKDWCAMHNVKETSYYYWLKKMRSEALESYCHKEEPSFIPLLPNFQNKNRKMIDHSSDTKSDMTISHGDLTITLGENTSLEVILNILKVLKNA
jgi:hypothetical protein